MKRQALGRGLASLIPQPEEGREDQGASGLHWVAIEDLKPNQHQPRLVFDKKAIRTLSSSIKKRGVMQPLLVRRIGKGSYEIIAGERRWRASQMAGLKKVPVLIQDVNEKESLELALIENLQREDLNPIEEAKAYTALIKEFNYTQEQVAVRMEKDRATIANLVRLLKLPLQIQEDVEAGRLSMGHARALLAIEGQADQMNVRNEIIKNGLNVRQTEGLIKRLRAKSLHASKKDEKNWYYLEEELNETYATKVRVKSNSKGAGTIVFEFYSQEELINLVDKLQSVKQSP